MSTAKLPSNIHTHTHAHTHTHTCTYTHTHTHAHTHKHPKAHCFLPIFCLCLLVSSGMFRTGSSALPPPPSAIPVLTLTFIASVTSHTQVFTSIALHTQKHIHTH